MFKIKIFFYVELNKIVEKKNLNIELKSINCIKDNIDFSLYAAELNYSIIYKNKLSSVIELEVLVKIDIFSKIIIHDIAIEEVDMIINYNNKPIGWRYKFIENQYWYKIIKN